MPFQPHQSETSVQPAIRWFRECNFRSTFVRGKDASRRSGRGKSLGATIEGDRIPRSAVSIKTRNSEMKGNAARLGWFAAGLVCLLALGWVLTGSAGTPVLPGLPMDWTHRHVIFSQPATLEQARLLADEPRFWQQEYRRSVPRVMSDEMSSPEATNSMGFALKPINATKVHRDWSQDLGSGASLGAGNYPAKYGFQVNVANCASPGPADFVVFGTGLLGTSNQASVVAYDNLYSGCSGTVPQVYWAYNTNGGQTTTSPVFSQTGDQIAFVQNNGGPAASLVLVKWKSSTIETVSSPLTLIPTTPSLYFTCAAPPCMAAIPLTDGSGVATNDTTSSVFYDYSGDIAWVGDSGGWLHKFHPVFNGDPAEVRTAPWPVHVNPSSPTPLSSPVHDLVSGNLFVRDQGGFVERVNASSGVVTISGLVDHGTGAFAGPIVDPTAAKLYVFASSDGTTSCGAGTQPCSAVYLLPTNFAAGATTPKTAVGTSSATPNPMYAGGFDSAYLSSANATGNLYVCGNTGGVPGLYRIPIAAGVAGAVVAGPALASANTGCSSVTDIPNPNGTGGATEWIFASVQNNGLGTICASGGCLINFKNQPWQASTVYAVGQQVLDTHFQIQTVRVGGTSRATTPAWSTTVGATTADNTVRWLNQGRQVVVHNTWLPAHAYALNTVIVDSNGSIQLVTTAGTSRTALQGHPAWSLVVNAITADNTVRWRNLGSVATASLAASGGTSGIIIDNTVGTGTMAGASQVYFSTQGNQTCGTSGTGGCAVQASQSALQ